jgi:hypothetical protein
VLRVGGKKRTKMNTTKRIDEITPEWLGIVSKQVESLRFGVVQITVHESRVVQIEKTEKVRLDRNDKNEAH